MPPAAGTPDAPARQWAMAAHLSALGAMLIGFAFLGPLVVYLVKGNGHPFVRQQSLEALNFNLSWLLYGVVGAIVTLVGLLVVVGLVLVPVLIAGAIAWLVLIVVASMRVHAGEPYRYPLTIRFFK